MGAGNADNTKAASAMADIVLFCWRSIGKNPAEEGATNKTSPTTAAAKRADHDIDCNPHLMLYVDRTSAETAMYGKCLYRIPIAKDGRLLIPGNKSSLQSESFRLTPDTYRDHLSVSDLKQIDRINNMQGVA
jgi:hypothetical protein